MDDWVEFENWISLCLDQQIHPKRNQLWRMICWSDPVVRFSLPIYNDLVLELQLARLSEKKGFIRPIALRSYCYPCCVSCVHSYIHTTELKFFCELSFKDVWIQNMTKKLIIQENLYFCINKASWTFHNFEYKLKLRRMLSRPAITCNEILCSFEREELHL